MPVESQTEYSIEYSIDHVRKCGFDSQSFTEDWREGSVVQLHVLLPLRQ